MAVSKNTRKPKPHTNQLFQNLFDKSQVSKEREREWQRATRYAGTGSPPLRFPHYETLYSLNVYAQKLVDLLKEVSTKFGIEQEPSLYHQSLIQYVRASVSRSLADSMSRVEMTESWLFEGQLCAEERKLFDHDDLYFRLRERESERNSQGLPRRNMSHEESSAKKSGQKSKPSESP
jgi:hypothetical protein